MSRSVAIPQPNLPARLKQKLAGAISGWFEHLEPHTRRSYRRGIVHFGEWLAGEGVFNLPVAPPLRSPDRPSWEDFVVSRVGQYLLALQPPNPSLVVQAYLHDLVYPEQGRSYTRSTAGNRLAALRWAVREARRMGQISWDLEVDLPPVKKDRSGRLVGAKGRDMTGPTKDQARTLLDAAGGCDDSRAPLIMSMLRYEGYREHEIRQIDFEDIDARTKTVQLVRKKRDAARAYPLSRATLGALRAWLDVRGNAPGPLLWGGKLGCRAGSRIGETTIYYLVQRLGQEVSVATSPHKIRHRACTDLVQRAVQLKLPEEEILFLTGHSSRAALQPYYDASRSRAGARLVLDSINDLIDEDN